MRQGACAPGAARAVVLSVGSGGDVLPLAAVAAQLAQLGVRTTWMAPQRYADLNPAGVSFRSAGADDVFDAVFSRPEVWTARHGLAESWRYYGAAALSSFQSLRDDWSPQDTVLVSSSFAIGARLAEEALGFLNTTVHLSPAVIFSYRAPPRWPAASIPRHWPTWLQAGAAALAERVAIDPTIARAIAPALQAAGLPPHHQPFSRFLHSPHRVAYLFPDWFAAAASDWPASGRYAGFPDAIPFVREMPAELAHYIADDQAPLAVITAGTAVMHRPGWVGRCASALLASGMRVLVLEPSGGATRDTRHPKLRFAPPAPLRALLPAARLLVHHGGIGTAVEALCAGTPQWLFPSAHDQADNTDRLCRLGVARGFRADVGEAELRQAAKALPDGEISAAAAALAVRMRAIPDATAQVAAWACHDLEVLARKAAVPTGKFDLPPVRDTAGQVSRKPMPAGSAIPHVPKNEQFSG